MKGNQQGRTAVSTKTLPRLILFLAFSSIWWVLFGKINVFLQNDFTEVELLQQKLWETNLKIKALETAHGKCEKSETNSIDDSDSDHLRTSIKTLFNGLAVNDNYKIRPLILENFIRHEGSSLNQTDIVMATQLSSSKFENVLLQLKYWNGPASVAVYIGKLKDIDTFFNFMEQNRPFLRDASFHLVLENAPKLAYPTNILRQVAMEAIESHYFLAMDVDLIPLPPDCHSHLMSTFSGIEIANKTNTLFVLPAFSLPSKKNEMHATEDMLPLSKREAVNMLKKQQMFQFQKAASPGGHAPTQNGKWRKETNTSGNFYDISITKKESIKYEPYVLGFKPGIPRYWEGKRNIP
jgi:hypothetical protein